MKNKLLKLLLPLMLLSAALPVQATETQIEELTPIETSAEEVPGPDDGGADDTIEEDEYDDSDNDDDNDDDNDNRSSSSNWASDDDKSDAVNRLNRYHSNILIVNGDDLSAQQKKKLLEICDRGRNTIAGTDDLRDQELNDIEADTKKMMDEYVSSCISRIPQTTVDYLTVSDVFLTPVAKPGEIVTVHLPIINLGSEPLTNMIVTAKVSNSVKEFPFEIHSSGFSREVGHLAAYPSMEEARTKYADVAFDFITRTDVLDGYYPLEFDVVYERKGVAEKATLTTYVRCVGAPGTGTVEKPKDNEDRTHTPRIMVTGFTTYPEEVYAGTTFNLLIDVKNTSEETDVSNLQFDLRAAIEGKDDDTNYSTFLPTSGANSIYVSSLAAGETTTLQMEMSAKSDLVQKPYAIDLTAKYEDDDYNQYESNTSISVPVKQIPRLEFSSADVLPASIPVGDQSNIVFSLYNTGKTILYNVKVSFDPEYASGGDTYIGKLDTGSTGNLDATITATAPTPGEGLRAIITFENESGEVKEMDYVIPLTITEGDMGDDFNNFEDFPMEDYPIEDESMPTWQYAAIGGGVLLLVIIIISLIRRRMKKRREKALLEADDDDIELSPAREDAHSQANEAADQGQVSGDNKGAEDIKEDQEGPVPDKDREDKA